MARRRTVGEALALAEQYKKALEIIVMLSEVARSEGPQADYVSGFNAGVAAAAKVARDTLTLGETARG